MSIEKGSYFFDFKKNNYITEKEKTRYEKEFNIIIKKNNFKRYEISNYAKDNNYSLHNMNYWKYNNYLGFGPSAHSKIDDLRIENKPDIDKYIKLKDYNKSYNLTKKELIEEYILMGLRLVDGIKIESFYKKFNLSIKELFKKTINKYSNKKMLVIKKNSIKITSRGLNILNTILTDFFNDLDYYNL